VLCCSLFGFCKHIMATRTIVYSMCSFVSDGPSSFRKRKYASTYVLNSINLLEVKLDIDAAIAT
jgi:hypothetical protein